jgi:NhaP-type Na+/H+ or K+/H+ antiporter
VTVIVALMGAGLALDRRPGWRSWQSAWRLIGITMPLSIAAVAGLGWWLLDLDPAAALLLGAALAPTDPVLAAEVRVPGPNQAEEDVVRRSLTSEAGLNDGLAFPFVYAAIGLVALDPSFDGLAHLAVQWVAWDLLGRTLIGVVVGIAVGRVFAQVAFRSRTRWLRLAEANEGMLALAATFTAYGAAEAVHGWGFVAVFVAGLSMRGYRRDADYHAELHRVSHQVERLLTLVALLMFGVACGSGLLAGLTWEGMAVAVLLVVLVRPLAGALALLGSPGTRSERWAKAWFGVRGIGSVYYLAYAFGEAPFTDQRTLWATASAAVLLSVVLHGATAAPALRRLDLLRERVNDSPRAAAASGG